MFVVMPLSLWIRSSVAVLCHHNAADMKLSQALKMCAKKQWINFFSQEIDSLKDVNGESNLSRNCEFCFPRLLTGYQISATPHIIIRI